MQLPSALLALALLASPPWLPAAQASPGWLTVMFMAKGSLRSAKQLFDTTGGVNTGNGTERLSILQLNEVGDFRSELIDRWTTLAPTEARLALFSRSGDVLWHVTFPGSVPCSTTWLPAPLVRASSSSHLLQHLYDLGFQFTRSSLRLYLVSSNQSYLFLDAPGDSNQVRFLFSTGAPQPLSPNTTLVDADTLLQDINPLNFTLSTAWLTITYPYTRYLLRIKLLKTNAGHLSRFRLHYKPGVADSPEFIPYRTENNQSKLFEPHYDAEGGATFDLDPVLTCCLTVEAVDWVDNVNVSIFFLFAPEGVLEAAYLAIQWKTEECFPNCQVNQTQLTRTAQEAARELVLELTVPRNSTAKYRRQFSSRPDQRGSAVMVGVVGGLVMALLAGAVVAMDVSLFVRQARIFRENARHCKARMGL